MSDMGWYKAVEKATIQKGTISEDGVDYEFRVLDPKFSPSLPNFVGLPDKKTLIISADVPVEYRPFFLVHEIICRVKLDGKNGHCIQALKEELSRVPPDIKAEYIAFRLRFFEELVKFYAGTKLESLKAEIQASLEYLRSL